VIFSRNRGSADRHGSDGKGRRGRVAEPDDDRLDEDDTDEDATPQREFGPYDSSEAPDDGIARLDLGAMQIPTIAGVEFQLQAGPDGQIQNVLLAYEDSRLQLVACAAPRTENIWDEFRETLRTSMAQAGARQEDTTGDYGPELKARLRDGTSTVDIRHVGVDGPRWFVHAIFVGPAAVDPEKAGPLADALRGLIVDRGTDARPVGEALPLRLPANITAVQPGAAEAEQTTTTAATDEAPAARRTARRRSTAGRGRRA
jgi:uncharacterized protein DUF3710